MRLTMFELIETHPPLNVQEAEYQRLLGYPKNHTLEGPGFPPMAGPGFMRGKPAHWN